MNLDTNENWTKAEIYDISGRILRSVSLMVYLSMWVDW
ncbi:MAG: hypothetical protein IPP49_16010 [Saprospiraceae bacterium]|nr:hypothetical protein [Saprospiraceae bacterium]